MLLPEFIYFLLSAFIFILLVLYVPGLRLPFATEPFLQFLLLAVLIFFTLVLHRFFTKLIDHFLEMVIITDLRIVQIKKTIFLKDTQEPLTFAAMQEDIKKYQEGFWRNVLNFGKLEMKSATNDVIQLLFVPRPDYYLNLITRLKVENKMKMIEQQKKKEKSVEKEFEIAFQKKEEKQKESEQKLEPKDGAEGPGHEDRSGS